MIVVQEKNLDRHFKLVQDCGALEIAIFKMASNMAA